MRRLWLIVIHKLILIQLFFSHYTYLSSLYISNGENLDLLACLGLLVWKLSFWGVIFSFLYSKSTIFVVNICCGNVTYNFLFAKDFTSHHLTVIVKTKLLRRNKWIKTAALCFSCCCCDYFVVFDVALFVKFVTVVVMDIRLTGSKRVTVDCFWCLLLLLKYNRSVIGGIWLWQSLE